jgi:hypothetical protein
VASEPEVDDDWATVRTGANVAGLQIPMDKVHSLKVVEPIKQLAKKKETLAKLVQLSVLPVRMK